MSVPHPMLFCLSGTLKGATVVPRENPVVLGTAPGCTVRFPPSEGHPVAGQHAEIVEAEGTFTVRSLSGEPILVNEAPTMEARLEQNDLIRLGTNGPVIRFRMSSTRRTTKTFEQMVVDSRSFATENARRSTRASRATSFARQLVKEAVAHGTRRLRTAVTVLSGVIILLAAALAWYAIQAESAKSDAEFLKGESGRMRSEMDAGREDRQDLRNALLAGDQGVDDLKRKLGGLVERQRDQDTSIQGLATAARKTTADLEEMKKLARVAERINSLYRRGVCFIYVGISFYNPKQKQFVRYSIDPATGKPDPDASFPVTLGGKGPKLIEWVSGSGFLVSDEGLIVSNRHVVDPWHEDKEFGGGLIQRGYHTIRESFVACFPGRKNPVEIIRAGVHPKMDVAVMRLKEPADDLPALKLSKVVPKLGAMSLLLGYPEGIRGLMNKIEGSVARAAIQDAAGDRRMGLVRALASRGGIRPTITQGVFSEVNAEQLVYDAVTFSGGSGGPLFDETGHVVGVNTAISRQFSGANYGLPIVYALEIVEGDLSKTPVYALPEIPLKAAIITPPKAKAAQKNN